MKIRQKLILGFLTVAMLVAIVGFISITVSQRALREGISESAEVLAADLLKDIERHIYMRIELLEDHCGDTLIQRAVAQSNREFDSISDVESYIAEQDNLWKSAPKGQTTEFIRKLLENNLSKELRKQSEYLRKKYGYPVFAETLITNKYGVNIGLTQKSSDYLQSDEEWWQMAKEDGLYVSDVEYDRSADSYSIGLCARIEDDTGEFLGIAKAVLNIHDTFAFLRDNLPVSCKLLTRDNRVIYSTDDYTLLEDQSKQDGYTFLRDHRHASELHGEPDYHEHASTLVSHTYSHGSEATHSILVAHVHSSGFRSFEGLGWQLIVEHDMHKIFASANRLKAWMLLVSGGITLLATLLGFFLSRSILIPLDKLVVAVERFGRGKFDTRVQIRSKDETGQLAEAFNTMVDDLKNSTISIDRLNAINQVLETNRQQLQASNQQLQNEVFEREAAERSLVGLNEELEQTIEKLARSNEELQDFAYIASHDLREPLRKISSFGELLRDSLRDTLDGDDRENLDFMIDGANRMSQMIEAMLVYSRVNTRDIALERVDLNEIIQQFREIELASLLEETRATIEVPTPLPKVMADTVLIRQLIQNLIVNGIKYRKDGVEPQIVITAENIDDRRVRIQVADNGIGIDQELHEVIFKMFRRLHPRHKYQGTGIGLAVCRRIAQRHGSEVRVDSTEGEGSAFSFTLTPARERVTAPRV